jgi:hypothetical protein
VRPAEVDVAALAAGGRAAMFRTVPSMAGGSGGSVVSNGVRFLLEMARVLLGVRMRVGPSRPPVLTSVVMSGTGQMIVPVRTVSGMVSLRCGRLPAGERVGIAFTTEAHLAAVMGAGQPWIQVSERALREMLEPLGVTRVQVDPGLIVTSLPVSVPA